MFTSSSDSSEEELELVVVIASQDDTTRKRKRVRRHDIPSTRYIDGDFHTLFKELLKDESNFFEYFRMSIGKFYQRLNLLKHDIRKTDTNCQKAVTPEERLAVTLRYLATGDSFKTIAFSYRLGHSTVHEIVHQVCRSISKILKPIVMPTPTPDIWRADAEGFKNQWDFPNCIGAIDGKHVTIQCPKGSGSLYFNYKKTFSVVLMAITDPNYKFIAVDIGGYGKNSDGDIFSNSAMGKACNTGKFNIPEDNFLPNSGLKAPYVIVGDEALPLKSYLMRPYPGTQLDAIDKKKFNYRLSRARRVVENSFGILSQKWRLYNRRIQLAPENVDMVIMATCCLHNFLIDSNKTIQHLDEAAVRNETLQPIPKQGSKSSTIAFTVRENFKDYLNNSPPRGIIISTSNGTPWRIDQMTSLLKYFCMEHCRK